MKKRILLALGLASLLALAGCTKKAADTTTSSESASESVSEPSSESASATGELKTITVGASPAPHAEILEAAKPVLKEVDAGVIEAAKSMGASNMQIIFKVLLPESKPSLLVGAAISVTTILGYSAMAGFTGGGGLGTIAINYGYYRYQTDIMFITVAILVILVQIIQEIFMRSSKHSDKRVR